MHWVYESIEIVSNNGKIGSTKIVQNKNKISLIRYIIKKVKIDEANKDSDCELKILMKDNKKPVVKECNYCNRKLKGPFIVYAKSINKNLGRLSCPTINFSMGHALAKPHFVNF